MQMQDGVPFHCSQASYLNWLEVELVSAVTSCRATKNLSISPSELINMLVWEIKSVLTIENQLLLIHIPDNWEPLGDLEHSSLQWFHCFAEFKLVLHRNSVHPCNSFRLNIEVLWHTFIVTPCNQFFSNIEWACYSPMLSLDKDSLQIIRSRPLPQYSLNILYQYHSS